MLIIDKSSLFLQTFPATAKNVCSDFNRNPPVPTGGVIGQNIFYWKEETLDIKEECTEEEDPLLIKSPSSEGKQKDNFYFHSSICIMFKLVFRILFILIWIRIRGSTSGNKGSGFGKKFLYLLTCRGICQDPCCR